MKGLEASEVRRAQLNDDTRADAEFFRKKYIADDAQISRHEVQPLGELAFITDGQHGYHEVDEDSPIHMLTAQSARGWFTDTTGADRIARWVNDNNKRSSLQESDLILSTRGTVGLCAIVMPEVLPANIDQDVARLHLKSKKLIPEYLLAYLNSSYGQDWMSRNQSGAVQQGLSLAKVRTMPIPLLSRSIQQRIGGIIGSAYRQLVRSREQYAQAESLLLRELRLDDWQPEEPLSYEASSREVFAAARLDAEYYQPKIKSLIKLLSRTSTCVSDLAPLRKETFTPNPRKEFTYIEIGQVSADGTATGTQLWGGEAPSRATWIVHGGDVITSTVRPIRRLSAIIQPEQNGFVCSSGFAVLHPTEIPSEVLLVFLRLPPVANLMDLQTTASMYPAISVENILALPFPAPDNKTNTEVVKSVRASFQAKRDSQFLLEKAQRAVEIAIERGEAAANEYLDGKAYVQARALPAMTEQHKYFSLDALKAHLAAQKLSYAPETVNAYVGRMKQAGKIFGAGRGWYSSLETPFEIDPEPVAMLVADIEKKFPLLDFACWSTGQLNPYLHHMLGKFVPFVYVERDAMSSVYDALQELGYRAYLNPTRREVEKSFNVADKTVVIRPAVAKAPGDGHVARVEKMLVDLHVELDAFPLIERDEFREAAQAMISQRRIELAKLLTYAAQRKVVWREIFMNPDAVIAGGEPA